MALLAGPLHGQQSETESLRATVGAWVETMQKVQEEQARWTREKQVLQANKEGLEQEIADLEESIASAKGRLDSAGKEEQEKLEQKRENDEARTELATALTAAEAEARAILPLLPEFLLRENTKLGAAVDSLKASAELTEEQQGKDLGKRLNAVVLVLTEAEKFQMQTWVRDEERKVNGEDMIVTTIYFGLSNAFSADQQGTVALRGMPGSSGWEFTALSEGDAPARILKLIEVASLKGEIDFVEIPLEVN